MFSCSVPAATCNAVHPQESSALTLYPSRRSVRTVFSKPKKKQQRSKQCRPSGQPRRARNGELLLSRIPNWLYGRGIRERAHRGLCYGSGLYAHGCPNSAPHKRAVCSSSYELLCPSMKDLPGKNQLYEIKKYDKFITSRLQHQTASSFAGDDRW